jgi:death-on-curing family protein
MYGEKPETVHEKAFDLMRLIASNHWFVDGNKRTALNTTNLFYLLNGYDLEYGEDLRSMLKLLAVREQYVEEHGEEPPEEFMRQARNEIVHGVASKDRDDHRDIYDALANE